MPAIDLARFFAVHSDFSRALAEIEAGRKRSHWMWYVFPQLAGLGESPTARTYAIRDMAEAEAFLADRVLGVDYRAIVDAVWRQVVGARVSIRSLFGQPDDLKLVSSLTLFAAAARRLLARSGGVESGLDLTAFVEQADEILAAARAAGMPRCAVTEAFVNR